MKKTLLLSVLVLSSLSIFAQDRNSGFELSIGAEGGLPLGSFNTVSNIGLGGTAKAAYVFNENSAATFQTGFMSFGGKSYSLYGYSGKYPSINLIPFKAGFRYTLDGGIYFEPQLGFTSASASTTGTASVTGFTYAINAGYRVTPGIDVSARYETVSVSGGNLSFVGLRVAYSFSLSGN